HEEVRTESLAELKNHFETTPPKGEFVVVIGAK
ncbi:MAG: 16S rRNA C1402 (ribose-2'-O) methylase RsmI, partial [Oceanospirillaceae bacterium]